MDIYFIIKLQHHCSIIHNTKGKVSHKKSNKIIVIIFRNNRQAKNIIQIQIIKKKENNFKIEKIHIMDNVGKPTSKHKSIFVLINCCIFNYTPEINIHISFHKHFHSLYRYHFENLSPSQKIIKELK